MGLSIRFSSVALVLLTYAAHWGSSESITCSNNFNELQNFTMMNCSNPCFENCLMLINITQGQSVSAKCTSNNGSNGIGVEVHTSNNCDSLSLDSGDRWFQYNQKFFFRLFNNSVDILATNLGSEDNGTMIVCNKTNRRTSTLTLSPQCVSKTLTTIIVNIETPTATSETPTATSETPTATSETPTATTETTTTGGGLDSGKKATVVIFALAIAAAGLRI